jgi:hypothetical protein
MKRTEEFSIELHYRRCTSCGRFWAHELEVGVIVGRMCAGCKDTEMSREIDRLRNLVTDRNQKLDQKDRSISALKGAITRLGGNRK